MLTDDTLAAAEALVRDLAAGKLRIATVESCTGGLLSAAITAVSGSSDVFERGYVTYSNEAKTELVRVPRELIMHQGAVSEDVAQAMAEGAFRLTRVDITISITGIAGPGGGTDTKPVGLVHFGAVNRTGLLLLEHEVFPGDRAAVRNAAVAHALDLLRRMMPG
jgi:nicotinamide-nucleotide amidase